MVGSLESFELTDEWIEKMREIAPGEPAVTPRKPRKAVMFSESHGFIHWVIPHTAALLKVLAEESGALEIVETADPTFFTPKNLSDIDAVIFNNNCPKQPTRDSFLDLLEDEGLAEKYKDNVLEYVTGGGGVINIHGGIIAFNECPKWDEMMGGVFDFHPQQQTVINNIVDPDHPLTKAFEGEPLVHVDEPYLFTGTYTKKNFRPLLVMDTSTIVMREDQPPITDVCYTAWIKRYGSGRVFYCSPSHNAQSFDDRRLLRFILDGMQYALGDLECEDAPR